MNFRDLLRQCGCLKRGEKANKKEKNIERMLADSVTKEDIVKQLYVIEDLILEIAGNCYSVYNAYTSGQLI